jgi:hypothetical protein
MTQEEARRKLGNAENLPKRHAILSTEECWEEMADAWEQIAAEG